MFCIRAAWVCLVCLLLCRDKCSVDQGCVGVDIMIEQHDKYLSDLLDKYAPKKNIYVVDRPLNEWMTDDILTLKAIPRKK